MFGERGCGEHASRAHDRGGLYSAAPPEYAVPPYQRPPILDLLLLGFEGSFWRSILRCQLSFEDSVAVCQRSQVGLMMHRPDQQRPVASAVGEGSS